MTISNAVKQREYATGALEFLADVALDIAITVDDFNAIYAQSEAKGVGAKFGVAINESMDKLFIRELIRDADIPYKDFFRDQLTQTIRVIGTHSFIENALEKGQPDSDLVAYSQTRLDKVMTKLDDWASAKKATAPTTATSNCTAQKLNHPLEAVSAMREMRQLVDTVKISVLGFDEEKIRKSSTLANGNVDYKMVAAQLRHNHTNYDVLRISRKIRRNTYWKLTAQPAIRIAVCEKLLLVTEDPALHFRLIQEIEIANAEFQKKLRTVATAPNFTAAIDDLFIRTAKRKVFKKEKCNFMLCLQTL